MVVALGVLASGAHSLVLPRLIAGPTGLGGLARLAGVAPRRRRWVRSPAVLVEGRVDHQIGEHLLSRGQHILIEVPHRPVRGAAPRLIMKGGALTWEIEDFHFSTVCGITTTQYQ